MFRQVLKKEALKGSFTQNASSEISLSEKKSLELFRSKLLNIAHVWWSQFTVSEVTNYLTSQSLKTFSRTDCYCESLSCQRIVNTCFKSSLSNF